MGFFDELKRLARPYEDEEEDEEFDDFEPAPRSERPNGGSAPPGRKIPAASIRPRPSGGATR